MIDRASDMRHILSQIALATGGTIAESNEEELEPTEFPRIPVSLSRSGQVVISAFEEDDCIQVYAMDGDDQIAVASYEPNRGYFRRIDVEAPYRRQGLATAIYNYISDLGYTIKPSPYQQPDGVAFWNSGNNPRSKQK